MTEAHADVAYDQTLLSVKRHSAAALVDTDIIYAQRLAETSVLGDLDAVALLAVITVFARIFPLGFFRLALRSALDGITIDHL